MNYYNSIQDGTCCRSCFSRGVEQVMRDAPETVVAVSEEFRFGSAQVISRVQDLADGVQDPFSIDHDYVDRIILSVEALHTPDQPDTIREIIIISNNGDPKHCLGWGFGINHQA